MPLVRISHSNSHMDMKSETMDKIERLCAEDLIGVPVSNIEEVYERVYGQKLEGSIKTRYGSVAELVRAEMSVTVAEVEYDGRRLFVSRDRAEELVNKRPDAYRMVLTKSKIVTSEKASIQIPSSNLPAFQFNTPLRRPKATTFTQTSNSRINPSESGWDPRTDSSSNSSTESLYVEAVCEQRSLTGSPPITPPSIPCSPPPLMDFDDDETKSIIEEESQTEFSPYIENYKKTSLKIDTRLLTNVELDRIPSTKFLSDFRMPSKNGSIAGFVEDESDSDAESDVTINFEQEVFNGNNLNDSGHESPDTPTSPDTTSLQTFVSQDILQSILTNSLAKRKELVDGIEKHQSAIKKLQEELKEVQSQSQEVLFFLEKMENSALEKETSAKLADFLQVANKKSDAVNPCVPKFDWSVVQGILSSK